MDYATAREFILTQGRNPTHDPDTILERLQRGSPPVPGQITSLLLALKVTHDSLRDRMQLERDIVYALHQLAMVSRQTYQQGLQRGVNWPPLLNDDITRIQIAVHDILAG